jgi:hypothetical protein
MRKTLALALWAALFAGGCDRQPAVAGPKPLVLELGADGRMRADGRAVTLDELGSYLYERHPDSPMDDVALRASDLDVVLRVAPDACWLHVQWMLTICVEEKFHRTWFEGSGGRLVRVFQPFEPVILPSNHQPDARALCVTIDIYQDEGGEMLFRCGERFSRDVRAVDDWVADALQTGRPETFSMRVGEIRAPPRTACRHVLAVMEALAHSGIEKVLPHGFHIPQPAVRRNPVLPAPNAERYPPSGLGVRSVPYDPEFGGPFLIDDEKIEEPAPDAPLEER